MESQRRRCVVIFYYLAHTGKLKGRKTTYTDRRGARHKAHRHNTRHDYRPLYYPAKPYLIFSLQSTAPLEAPPNRTLYCPFKVLHSSDRYTTKKTLCTFLFPSRDNTLHLGRISSILLHEPWVKLHDQHVLPLEGDASPKFLRRDGRPSSE